MHVKKTPLRKCTGCGEMKPKKELVRVVKSPEGEVSLDLTGRLPETGPQSETVGKSLFLSDSRRGVRSHGGGIRGK